MHNFPRIDQKVLKSTLNEVFLRLVALHMIAGSTQQLPVLNIILTTGTAGDGVIYPENAEPASSRDSRQPLNLPWPTLVRDRKGGSARRL